MIPGVIAADFIDEEMHMLCVHNGNIVDIIAVDTSMLMLVVTSNDKKYAIK